MIRSNALDGIDPLTILLQLGSAGEDEPVLAGVIVFGLVGLTCLYLYYVRTEIDAGPVIRVMGYACIALALLSLFWPLRPWPT